ncbi:hypothetical protein M434DRAFT_310877 [Hypoxylon sp. CO27-5]|nr:hypothetical protein M434DRAFT_310877 [Hypoxylon sp. CO27-5]
MDVKTPCVLWYCRASRYPASGDLLRNHILQLERLFSRPYRAGVVYCSCSHTPRGPLAQPVLQFLFLSLLFQTLPWMSFLFFLSYCPHMHSLPISYGITTKRNEQKGGADNSEEALGWRPINGGGYYNWMVASLLSHRQIPQGAKLATSYLHGWGAAWLYTAREGTIGWFFYACAVTSLDLIIHRIAKKTEIIFTLAQPVVVAICFPPSYHNSLSSWGHAVTIIAFSLLICSGVQGANLGRCLCFLCYAVLTTLLDD